MEMENKKRLFVVIHLHSPKEKYWGILLKYSSAGTWITGINLKGFEEFINSCYGELPDEINFTTSFFPMYRVEKITLDESMGEIPSMKEFFESKTGKNLDEIVKSKIENVEILLEKNG